MTPALRTTPARMVSARRTGDKRAKKRHPAETCHTCVGSKRCCRCLAVDLDKYYQDANTNRRYKRPDEIDVIHVCGGTCRLVLEAAETAKVAGGTPG